MVFATFTAVRPQRKITQNGGFICRAIDTMPTKRRQGQITIIVRSAVLAKPIYFLSPKKKIETKLPLTFVPGATAFSIPGGSSLGQCVRGPLYYRDGVRLSTK